MNVASVLARDVSILVRVIKTLEAVFVPVPPAELPKEFSRRLGFDLKEDEPPLEPILRAISGVEPVGYRFIDYRYTNGRLSISVQLPFGDGVHLHNHHPVITVPDFTMGIFFATSHMDSLVSDVQRGEETIEYSTGVVESWDLPDIVLTGRTDWMVKES